MGQVKGAAAQPLQFVLPAFDETGTHRRRRAEQVKQQPGIAPEIANQREITFVRFAQTGNRPDDVRQGKIVMNAGDHLHAFPIAVRKAGAIHGLHAPDVGAPVAADWNGIVRGQAAGHA